MIGQKKGKKRTINTSCPQGRRRRYDRRRRLRRHRRGNGESLTDKICSVDRPRFWAYVAFSRFLSLIFFRTDPRSGYTLQLICAHEMSEIYETGFTPSLEATRVGIAFSRNRYMRGGVCLGNRIATWHAAIVQICGVKSQCFGHLVFPKCHRCVSGSALQSVPVWSSIYRRCVSHHPTHGLD
jgi:hypothetical protein